MYPILAERLGVLRVYKYGIFLFAITAILIPSISLLPSQAALRLHSLQYFEKHQQVPPATKFYSNSNGYLLNQLSNNGIISYVSNILSGRHLEESDTTPLVMNQDWSVFILVILGLSFISISSMWVIISIFVLINNSCYSHERGKVNGIGQTFASLGRLSGPYIAANVFAWSEVNGMSWPFNYYFSWYILGIVSLIFMKFADLLPKTIQRRKREPKEPRYSVYHKLNEEEFDEIVDSMNDDDDDDEEIILNSAHYVDEEIKDADAFSFANIDSKNSNESILGAEPVIQLNK